MFATKWIFIEGKFEYIFELKYLGASRLLIQVATTIYSWNAICSSSPMRGANEVGFHNVFITLMISQV